MSCINQCRWDDLIHYSNGPFHHCAFLSIDERRMGQPHGRTRPVYGANHHLAPLGQPHGQRKTGGLSRQRYAPPRAATPCCRTRLLGECS